MSQTYRLCSISDVEEGEPVGVYLDTLPALAVYKIDDEYYVTDNLCTHGNAMLSDGYQEGELIECPFHGGSFEIKTGKAAAFPCQIPINTYPVIIEDGWIAIQYPREEN